MYTNINKNALHKQNMIKAMDIAQRKVIKIFAKVGYVARNIDDFCLVCNIIAGNVRYW